MKSWLKSLFLLAVVSAVGQTSQSFADDNSYATFHIVIEDNPQVSEVSPVVTSPITRNQVAFHIVNHTSKALYFANGDQSNYIPLVSNNTVTVPYKAGEQYKVVDGQGQTVAVWNLNGGAATSNASSSQSSASASQYSEWSSQLQRVIENQKVTYQEPVAKAEPHYYEQSSSKRASSNAQQKTVVRGYW